MRLREAPDYPLARGDALIKGEQTAKAEDALDIAEDIPVETTTSEPLKLFE